MVVLFIASVVLMAFGLSQIIGAGFIPVFCLVMGVVGAIMCALDLHWRHTHIEECRRTLSESLKSSRHARLEECRRTIKEREK